MKIEIDRPTDLELTGIYKITNKVNNKYYIGSTSESFLMRWKNHINALRKGKHKNIHLQNAFIKYGEESFIFTILEICKKENCLLREQIYLDSSDSSNCYNINPFATGPCLTEESLLKQSISIRQFYKDCLAWYDKYKNKKCSFEEIPDRFKSKIESYINHIPWNKGNTYESTDHLKVPHKKSDRSNVKNTMRNKSDIVYVYDLNLNFIDRFRSSKDLEELSTNLILPIKSRFSQERMKKPISYLGSGNINKAIKTNKPYKGLYFFNKPLHPGMDDVNKPKSVEVWNDNTEVN